MMRFIKLDGQILSGDRRFAFYDTVIDKFVELMGEQTWDSVEDLQSCFDSSQHNDLRDRLVGLARGNRAAEKRPEDDFI